MRLLRAFLHIALGLATMTATVAQARMAGVMPAGAIHQANHDVATIGELKHAAHHCDDGPVKNAPHQADDCRMACCFIPAQLPARIAEAGATDFRKAHYTDVTRLRSGQINAPDPEVPKDSV